MRTKILVVLAAALLFSAAGLAIGYGLSSPSRTASQSSLGQTSVTETSSSSIIYPSRANVAIVGSGGNGDDAYFAPLSYTVAVGAVVTWTNQDRGVIHNVVSTSGQPFNSGDVNSGTAWSLTFSKPGTYYYECTYHPWMTGSIVVVGQTAAGG